MSDEAGFEIPESIRTALLEERLNPLAINQIKTYLGILTHEFQLRQRQAVNLRDSLYKTIAPENSIEKDELIKLESDYYNNWLASFILNRGAVDMYIEKPKRIIRKFEPGFMAPTANNGRAHFCAPFKILGNTEIDTFWFNLAVIWIVSILLYIALYFNFLQKLVSGFGEGNKRRSESSFLIIKEISSW